MSANFFYVGKKVSSGHSRGGNAGMLTPYITPDNIGHEFIHVMRPKEEENIGVIMKGSTTGLMNVDPARQTPHATRHDYDYINRGWGINKS